MMKRYFLLLFFALMLPVLSVAGEVFFIPGWYTQWINYSGHSDLLQEIFPGDTVRICKWQSNRLWQNAKTSADEAVKKISSEVAASPEAKDITLIGHSLGGRIVLDCAALLAGKNIAVKQLILLGTAGGITPEEIAACRKVSRLPVINIFCPDDNMLKLYVRKEKSLPLGFAGLPSPLTHFRQYRLPVPHEDLKLWKITLSDEMLEPLRETAAHLAKKYIFTLQDAVNGKCAECYMDWGLWEEIAGKNSVKPDHLPGFSVVEEFGEWKLLRRKFRPRCRISSPSGNRFDFTDEKTARENFAAVKKVLSGN